MLWKLKKKKEKKYLKINWKDYKKHSLKFKKTKEKVEIKKNNNKREKIIIKITLK